MILFNRLSQSQVCCQAFRVPNDRLQHRSHHLDIHSYLVLLCMALALGALMAWDKFDTLTAIEDQTDKD